MNLADSDVRMFDLDLLLETALFPPPAQPRAARELHEIAAAYRGSRPPRPSPHAMVHLPQRVLDQRALGVADLTLGGSLVGTESLQLTFSRARYAASVLGPAGATFVPLTASDAEVPTIGRVDICWIGEGAEIAESTPTTGLRNFIMRTVAAHVDVERRLIKHGIAAILLPELARALGEAEEKAAFAGLGYAREPLGLIYTPDVPVGAMGTNGGLPTHEALLDLAGPVLDANPPRGSLGFITSAAMRDTLARTTVAPAGGDVFVWQAPPRADADGSIGTFPAWGSTAVPSTLTKGSAAGVCSAILFGAWSDLAIARWGGVDIILDPYTNAKTGMVRVFAYADVDVVVARPESFAMILDALSL